MRRRHRLGERAAVGLTAVAMVALAQADSVAGPAVAPVADRPRALQVTADAAFGADPTPGVPPAALAVEAAVLAGSSGGPVPVPAAAAGGAVSPLAASGIPATASEAYVRAAAAAPAGCGVDWSLVAAIGRVESNHGRFAGAVLHTDGRSSPAIVGIALDGVRTALIRDTDGGRLDGDTVYDRAVGPMQFIPSTWAVYDGDGDGDGRSDPFDIHDAAAGTARYLCAAGGDLTSTVGQRRAVFAYNHSEEYVATVLTLAAAYAGAPPPVLPAAVDEPAPVLPPANPAPPPAATADPAPATGPASAGGASPRPPSPSTTSASPTSTPAPSQTQPPSGSPTQTQPPSGTTQTQPPSGTTQTQPPSESPTQTQPPSGTTQTQPPSGTSAPSGTEVPDATGAPVATDPSPTTGSLAAADVAGTTGG